ncbi:hypothetical protein ACT3SZ_09830 [Corynebacterium sp. AOP40-9SA-29]|uniref:hypothetical protein n=1 Tax=Corynebacterium sp. AOP40-9SA-29 TaxID=3457677 RepID=UPI004033C939
MSFDAIADLFQRLAEYAASVEPWQQFLVILLAGAVPFIESYLGSFLGVALGIEPSAAVVATAVLGNVLSTFALIALAARARRAATSRRGGRGDGGGDNKPPSNRQQKIARYVEKIGVPGVSLLGPIILASQITGPTLVALGANKRAVYLFQGVAIIAWGVLFGFFGDLVISWYL